MSRSVIRVSVPSTELVTSADMSPMLHGYPSSEESFLTMTIAAARDLVEGHTGYSLAASDFIQYADRFPMQGYDHCLAPFNYALHGLPGLPWEKRSPLEIEFRRNPALTISKIEYVDTNGVTQTLEPGTDFAVDLTCSPARVMPLPRMVWPVALRSPKAVALYYTAGFTPGAAASVETLPTLKAIVMALTEKWFINRNNYGEVPAAIWDLINSNRVTNYNPGIE